MLVFAAKVGKEGKSVKEKSVKGREYRITNTGILNTEGLF